MSAVPRDNTRKRKAAVSTDGDFPDVQPAPVKSRKIARALAAIHLTQDSPKLNSKKEEIVGQTDEGSALDDDVKQL